MVMGKGRGVEVSKVFLFKLEARPETCTFTGYWFVEHKHCVLCLGIKSDFFFPRSNLSCADVERVMSVMNDARGTSPMCSEVFISYN